MVQLPPTAIKYHTAAMTETAAVLQKHLYQHGYRLMDVPIIEDADLFLTKAGDQLVEQLFTFERHGRQLALCPEFTAAAAYHYALSGTNDIARWQFYGPVFVDNPADFGHNYQRQSIGAELIGMSGSIADSEVIALAAGGLLALGMNSGWQVAIGHIGLIRELLKHFELDSRTERFLLNHLPALRNPALGQAYVIEHLDNMLLVHSNPTQKTSENPELVSEHNTQQVLDVLLDATQRGMTMGGRSRHDIARRLLQKRQRLADRQQIIAALDFLAEWSEIEGATATALKQMSKWVETHSPANQHLISALSQTVELLQMYDIPDSRLVIRPGLARGWDYYTGIVFEIHTDDGLHLGGGGRYDELVSLVGGRGAVPAVGFAYYLDQLFSLLKPVDHSRSPIGLGVSDDNADVVLRWAHHLRQHGLSVQLISESTEHAHELTVNPNDTMTWNNEQYSFNQIAVLAEALRQRQIPR